MEKMYRVDFKQRVSEYASVWVIASTKKQARQFAKQSLDNCSIDEELHWEPEFWNGATVNAVEIERYPVSHEHHAITLED